MTMTETDARNSTELPKVVYQLRRARRLVAEFRKRWPATAAAGEGALFGERLQLWAQQIDTRGWGRLAEDAGMTEPSADTIALAVELLTHRTDEDLVDLLDAVREAITLPMPATYGDEARHDGLLRERLSYVRLALTEFCGRRSPSCHLVATTRGPGRGSPSRSSSPTTTARIVARAVAA